ncbi:MAG: hypothetical protein ACYTAF_01680 [Planctomycetota bacterium]|jgi:hypothetical protein
MKYGGAAVAAVAAVIILSILGLTFLRPAPPPEPPPAPTRLKKIVPPKPPPSPDGALPEEDPVVRKVLRELPAALRDGRDDDARSLLDALFHHLLPPVPDDRNAALLYLRALRFSEDLQPDAKEMSAWDKMITDEEVTEEDIALLDAVLRRYEEQVSETCKLLHDAAQLPACRFPRDQEDAILPAGFGLSHAVFVARVLRTAATVDMARGSIEKAALHLRAAMAFARALRTEPTIINQLNACNVDRIIMQSLASLPELMIHMPDPDLLYVRHSFRRALLGQIYFVGDCYLEWKSDPGTQRDDVVREWMAGATPGDDVATCMEALADFHRLPDAPFHELRPELIRLAERHADVEPWLENKSLSLLHNMPDRWLSVTASESQRAMLRLASDLERHRAFNGSYPASLGQLTSPCSRDPFTGKDFLYRTEGKGYVIESPHAPDGKPAVRWAVER